MLEEIGGLLDSHPLLWVLYGFLVTTPLVAICSCLLWRKVEPDSVGQRKKTDTSQPDVRAKDDASDSGFEASGEVEERRHRPSEERELSSPSSLHPESLDSESGPDAATSTCMQQLPGSRDQEAITEETQVNGGPRQRDVKHLQNNPPSKNGTEKTVASDSHTNQNGVDTVDDDTAPAQGWSFPPVLEDFDLMENDMDPSYLEDIFADKRLIEVKLRVEPPGPGIAISIVGGSGSPQGDLPILVRRVLPGSLVEGLLKPGDELVAVNEVLLMGASKQFAIDSLSEREGEVRLLALQDE